MQKATSVEVKFEIEDDGSICVVFDRQCDGLVLPWQDAVALADAGLAAVADASGGSEVIDPTRIEQERRIFRFATDGPYVQVAFPYGDRVRLHWRVLGAVLQWLKIKAQDAQFAQTGVALPTFRRRGNFSFAGGL
jgi:hypothetical protein